MCYASQYFRLKIYHICQQPFSQQHLACGHEEGEDEDEGALGHWQPVNLLQGEEDSSVQAGFGRAAETKDKLSAKTSVQDSVY